MTELEPRPQEKIKAIVVCDDPRAEPLARLLKRDGIEVLGRFDNPLCTEIREFWDQEEKFDVAIVHTNEEHGRKFVQDARRINPNLFILTFSAGWKILRFGDSFIVYRQKSFAEMLKRIYEGVETKRKTANQ